jgi:hypothetical protein
MTPRRITFEGPAARGAVIAADVLVELLDMMLDGSRKAVRLLVEGRSTASGTPPAWLEGAVVFDMTGLEQGSTVVSTSARPLRETLPEHLARIPTLDRTIEAATGLDVWFTGLGDAISGKRDSDRFDAELLETYTRFARILAKGFEAIGFEGPQPLRIGPAQVGEIAQLLASVPLPRQVRIAGKLEQLDPTGRRFTLTLQSGLVLGVVDESVPSERVAEWLGKPVVASGLAVFRPSGALLRLEAHRFDKPAPQAALRFRRAHQYLSGAADAE